MKIMKHLKKIPVLTAIALTYPLMASAQETVQADLGACVAYLNGNGDMVSLVGGTVCVAIVAVFAFMKKSIPQVLKQVIDGFVKAKGKPNQK